MIKKMTFKAVVVPLVFAIAVITTGYAQSAFAYVGDTIGAGDPGDQDYSFTNYNYVNSSVVTPVYVQYYFVYQNNAQTSHAHYGHRRH